VIFVPREECCGALVHHLGREPQSLQAARANIDAWTREIEGDGLDAIVVTASGCGTTLKNYGHMLRDDPEYASKSARVSALAKDITEVLVQVPLSGGNGRGLTVALHSACSLQHGQGISEAPGKLLAAAGFEVRSPREAHLCCGSAGTYNILQSQLAGQLADRKISSLERLQPDVIATSNIGCAMQLAARTSIPVVHVVELLDWATGGPRPPGLPGNSI
jgi:glycolate oxidase iron-sulfur subunit